MSNTVVSFRLALSLGLVCAALGCAGPERQPVAASPEPAGAVARSASAAGLRELAVPETTMPLAERLQLERALADAEPARHPQADREGGYTLAGTPGATLAISVRGARFPRGSAGVELAVAGVGRARAVPLTTHATPRTAGAEVQRELAAGVIEWWRSLPSGFEHGLTLAQRPAGEGALVVEVALEGARARSTAQGAVELLGADGALVARYGDLLVLDARGAEQRAHMRVSEHGVRIEVDDGAAAYPLVIDPLLVVEELLVRPEWGLAYQTLGVAVALSADGSRALVGSRGFPNAFAPAGPTRVFVRSGAEWVYEAALLPQDVERDDGFGETLALSADGSVAFVGAPWDDTDVGAGAGSVRVFVREGTSWSELATLLPSDGAEGDGFGRSIALSADGSVALIGAPGDDAGAFTSGGSARVLVRDGASWSELATLLPSDEEARCFGEAVALSADGSQALVGAPCDNSSGLVSAGSARVFEGSGASWSEVAVLRASNAAESSYYGGAVALSADGSRALVARSSPGQLATLDEVSDVRVFARAGDTWSEEAALVPADGRYGDRVGLNVALSAQGDVAVVTAPWHAGPDGLDEGSVRVFVRSETTWTQTATLLASGDDNTGFWDVATIAADGSYVLAGLGSDSTRAPQAGAARAFVRESLGVYTEAGVLLAPPQPSEPQIGAALALSANGDRAFIGAPAASTASVRATGWVRVFARDGSVWSEETRLLASDAQEDDQLGWQVAPSADASLVLVSARGDDTEAGQDAGSVRVFERSGTDWSEAAPLLAPDGAAGDTFGAAVALSGDGQRAFVSATYADAEGAADVGRVYVFTRELGAWTLESALAAPSAAARGFGWNLALDASGSRALIAMVNDGSDHASAWEYTRDAGAWTRGAMFQLESAGIGPHVALSADGLRALVGGRIYARHEGAWREQSLPLVQQPYAITLSADGRRASVAVAAVWGAGLVIAAEEASSWKAATTAVSFWSVGGYYTPIALSADGSRALTLEASGGVRVLRLDPSPVGAECTQGLQCASGFCADGVCCEEACGGDSDCMGCRMLLTGQPSGTCAPLLPEAVPSYVCRPAAGPCDFAETCTLESSECPADTLAPAQTVCEPSWCAAGTETVASTCDGLGAACPEPEPTTRTCAPFVCGASACFTTCTSDAHCISGLRCDDATGACEPPLPVTSTCTRNRECASGACVDGICCSTACGGRCEACDLEGHVGECMAVTGEPRGVRTACDTNESGCEGACDGVRRVGCTYTCSAELADGGEGDASSESDASADDDSGLAGDASTEADASDPPRHADASAEPASEASCSCNLARTRSAPHPAWLALCGLALALRARRLRTRRALRV